MRSQQRHEARRRPSVSCRQSCERLLHQRVIGHLALAGEVLGAGQLVGEDDASSRSSASLRWNCGGTLRLPFRCAARRARRVAFQRQRVREHRRVEQRLHEHVAHASRPAGNRVTSSSGKLCVGPSESTMLSSSAAACSSKLNLRQKRLRSARPQARLMREPKGEWITRCVSPTSSKKRSKTMRPRVGSTPSAALRGGRGTRRAASPPPRAASASLAARCAQASIAVARAARRLPRAGATPRGTVRRVRPGASPNQNGMVGGCPCASSTQHLAGLDLDDAVGGVAELEDVAGQALEREVLVQRADAVAPPAAARRRSRTGPGSRRRW